MGLSRSIRAELERFSGLVPGAPRGRVLRGWHDYEPAERDGGKSTRVRRRLLEERRKPTEEELYWLAGWERGYALKGQWWAWEQELARREAGRVEEHGGLGWKGDAMREQLEGLKRSFEPLIRRYREFLLTGDLDDPRCHLAMVVVQMEGATTMQQFSRLVQELHRLRGQYEAKLKVEQAGSGDAAAMAEEVLKRLGGGVEAEVLEFPSAVKGEVAEGE